MAFCTNCGAKLDEGAAFCTSCGTSVNSNNNSVATQKPSHAHGLGGAITSAVLGFVGFIFSIITYIVGMGAALGLDSDTATAAIVLGVMSFVFGTISLVLGIKAIGDFKQGRALGAKPIATLIVGIGGTVMSGLTLLFAILGVMMASAVL